jgi:predicted negative regulator of RcsB-dependent stress response
MLHLALALLSALPPQAADLGGALDAGARRAIVETLAVEVEARYCKADVAEQIAAHLRAELAAGAFDGCTTRFALAPALTKALRAVNDDRHFAVYGKPEGRIEEERSDPLRTALRARAEERGRNHGFTRVEILPGNVGLLQLDGFADFAPARDTAAAAMRFLAGVDALIVDVRGNGGGTPEMVQFVCSYFFGERTHLNSLVFRRPEGEHTTEFWTLDELPGPRLVDVPLYVLTSGNTGSAAEEFCYNLQSRDRAILVGQTTGGAANPGGTVPLDERLVAFISDGQARNPVTGTNWEGVGVVPEVETPAAEALDKALALARAAADDFRRFREEEHAALLEELGGAFEQAGTHAAAGRDDEALKALRPAVGDAVERDVLDELALTRISLVLSERGDVGLGLAVARANAALFASSSQAHELEAGAWTARGNPDRAREAWHRALERDPGSEDARKALAGR